MDNITSLAFSLHDKLMESKEFKTLKEYETIMLNDESSKSLIDNYHHLQELYSSLKTNEMQTKLHKAKLLMDENENVINYKKAYKEYQLLIGKITDLVFDGFKNDTTLDKIMKIK